MEHNLPMGRFHRALRDRAQPIYPPVPLSAAAPPLRSDEQQLREAAAGYVEASQPEYGQVSGPPQQVRTDHADGQVAQQHDALVQRRALDYHLDRPRVDAERVE